jgi:mannan endo-1,4-beta-mannosidase
MCPTNVITKWAAETSKYIKSLDDDHMVTLGDEGWLTPSDGYGDGSYAYSGYDGVDFVENLKIPTLDYGVFHLYPGSWGYNYTWGNEVRFSLSLPPFHSSISLLTCMSS